MLQQSRIYTWGIRRPWTNSKCRHAEFGHTSATSVIDISSASNQLRSTTRTASIIRLEVQMPLQHTRVSYHTSGEAIAVKGRQYLRLWSHLGLLIQRWEGLDPHCNHNSELQDLRKVTSYLLYEFIPVSWFEILFHCYSTVQKFIPPLFHGTPCQGPRCLEYLDPSGLEHIETLPQFAFSFALKIDASNVLTTFLQIQHDAF